MKQVLPFTCLTHRSAYLSVLMVLDLPLLLFSDGKCIFSSFRVLKSSFCVFALADCSLLQRTYMRRIHVHQKNDRVSPVLSHSRVQLSSVHSRTGGASYHCVRRWGYEGTDWQWDMSSKCCISIQTQQWKIRCKVLTCTHWLKGCPAQSSPDWRHWSCWAVKGCESLSCNHKQHVMSLKVLKQATKQS